MIPTMLHSWGGFIIPEDISSIYVEQQNKGQHNYLQSKDLSTDMKYIFNQTFETEINPNQKI